MSKETVYAKGFYGKTPHENSPDWIVSHTNVKIEDAIEWLTAQKNSGKEWVMLDHRNGKEGNHYVTLNTFEKDKQD